jgi:hypothetical protein
MMGIGARLTPYQLDALRDAHRSISHGGLTEVAANHGNGTVWVGNHPDCAAEHGNTTVHFLFTEGLLDRTGTRPMREATITEEGILQLDIEEVRA